MVVPVVSGTSKGRTYPVAQEFALSRFGGGFDEHRLARNWLDGIERLGNLTAATGNILTRLERSIDSFEIDTAALLQKHAESTQGKPQSVEDARSQANQLVQRYIERCDRLFESVAISVVKLQEKFPILGTDAHQIIDDAHKCAEETREQLIKDKYCVPIDGRDSKWFVTARALEQLGEHYKSLAKDFLLDLCKVTQIALGDETIALMSGAFDLCDVRDRNPEQIANKISDQLGTAIHKGHDPEDHSYAAVTLARRSLSSVAVRMSYFAGKDLEALVELPVRGIDKRTDLLLHRIVALCVDLSVFAGTSNVILDALNANDARTRQVALEGVNRTSQTVNALLYHREAGGEKIELVPDHVLDDVCRDLTLALNVNFQGILNGTINRDSMGISPLDIMFNLGQPGIEKVLGYLRQPRAGDFGGDDAINALAKIVRRDEVYLTNDSPFEALPVLAVKHKRDALAAIEDQLQDTVWNEGTKLKASSLAEALRAQVGVVDMPVK